MIFVRSCLSKFRYEEYVNLRDAVINDSNTTNVGRVTIFHLHMVSVHVICMRTHKMQLRMSSIRLSRLFITFTCNSALTDIQQHLFARYSQVDRNDITACVFRQKLTCQMNFMVKHEVCCCMQSVEWQNRELDHAQIWLYKKILSNKIDALKYPLPTSIRIYMKLRRKI